VATAISMPPSREAGAGFGDLVDFRECLYDCLMKRGDAMFGVVDALCGPVVVESLAHLSLAAGHERRHGSVYGALAHGRIDAERLRDELALARDPGWPLVFAVDASTWCRNDAECSAERGYYYHSSRHSAGQPIVAGWSYQWIAQLDWAADSWTAPMDAVRLDPRPEAPGAEHVAAAQVRSLLGRLGPTDTPPLFVFDSGYDPVQLSVELSGVRAQTLTRVKSSRIFHFPAPPREPGRPGAPRRHGAKFRCQDESTWPEPDQVLITCDPQYGTISVAAWHGLHPMQRTYRDDDGAMTIVPGTLLRVQVERLPGRIEREAKALWLWWDAPEGTVLDLDVAWRAYVRRFDLEHTYRFAKQALGWTTPKIRTPEQADRWTWLVIAAYTQLRLARTLVDEHRLPWQPPLPPNRRTPGRVRRGFGHLLARLPRVARAPKPSGRPPGRPQGRRSVPAPRYPAIKKAA
jgi:DDE superfamily endonuclease